MYLVGKLPVSGNKLGSGLTPCHISVASDSGLRQYTGTVPT